MRKCKVGVTPPEPSTPRIWRQIDRLVPSSEFAGGIFVAPRGNGRGIRWATGVYKHRGRNCHRRSYAGTGLTLSRRCGGLSPGYIRSANATIYPVRTATTSDCGRNSAAAKSGQGGTPTRRMPGSQIPVCYWDSSSGQRPCSGVP